MDLLDLQNKLWNKKYLNLRNEDLINRPLEGDSSEHGENNVIDSVFSKVKPQNKVFVDAGAYGARSSNTYKLVEQGWRGVLIEENPVLIPDMKEKFRDNKGVKIIEAHISPTNLEDLIGYHLPINFDFLSIDVDSYEYEIWKNLTLYKPNLVCIEVNQFEPDFKVIDYDPSFSMWASTNKRDGYGGATIGLVNKLAKEKGYDYLCWDVSNAFYIRKGFVNGSK